MNVYNAETDYLQKYKIQSPSNIFLNMPTEALYEEIIKRKEGCIVKGGAVVFDTGKHTGRSAKDKYVVRESTSEKDINWSSSAASEMTISTFNNIKDKMLKYCSGKDLYVQELYAGASESSRLKVRIITEYAWHSMFARNMFICEADLKKLANFKEDFTVLYLPNFLCNPSVDGTKTETAIMLNFEQKIVLIAGTEYAGEMKKSIFTVMNYYLPKKGMMSMHCSANIGQKGDTALFFGLSGTGKTTLSSDPNRALIGDDEHGWDTTGIFNIEGGCYAKVIDLDQKQEPDIYKTTHTYGTILENVVFNEKTREIDLNSKEKTENTRSSYPLTQMPKISKDNKGGHPKQIIFLTFDAFGVLPPVAKLNINQAMYHFISGYTAKVAGTEKGITEPTVTFSTCFGEPFMVWHPYEYAKILMEKMKKHRVKAYLVNTGLTGGKDGKRFKINDTRTIINAILSGEIDKSASTIDPIFGFGVPTTIRGVDKKVLDPRKGWKNITDYNKTLAELASRFVKNFDKYSDHYMAKEVLKGAPNPDGLTKTVAKKKPATKKAVAKKVAKKK